MKRHAGAERTHGFLFKKRGHVYAEYLRETTLASCIHILNIYLNYSTIIPNIIER